MLGFSFLLISSMIKIITTETLNIIHARIEVCVFSSTLRNANDRIISRNRAKDLLLKRFVEWRVFEEANVACCNQFLQLRIVEVLVFGQ